MAEGARRGQFRITWDGDDRLWLKDDTADLITIDCDSLLEIPFVPGMETNIVQVLYVAPLDGLPILLKLAGTHTRLESSRRASTRPNHDPAISALLWRVQLPMDTHLAHPYDLLIHNVKQCWQLAEQARQPQ